MPDIHIHIHHDGYAPAKPPQVAEEPPAKEAVEESAHEDLTQRLDTLTTESQARMATYEKELQQLQKVTRDHYKRMAKEATAFQPPATKPPQASMIGTEEMSDEDDRDREYRLMRKYTAGETLTPTEFDFLKRRGCVRY